MYANAHMHLRLRYVQKWMHIFSFVHIMVIVVQFNIVGFWVRGRGRQHERWLIHN